MSVGPSAKNDSPNNTRMVTPPPKKSITTRVIDSSKNLITARKRAAHNLAGLIPGQKERLKNYRTDYRNYLTSKGSTPDFLQDDKNLTSFETYDKLINYKPTQRNPNEKEPLNYANYLADVKGNYGLKLAGNVGQLGTRSAVRDAAGNITGYKFDNVDKDGNITPKGGDNKNVSSRNQIKPVMLDARISPTEAEVSQSAATEAESEAYDLRKTKKRGRSITRLKSTKAVDDKLILGKRSLLGA